MLRSGDSIETNVIVPVATAVQAGQDKMADSAEPLPTAEETAIPAAGAKEAAPPQQAAEPEKAAAVEMEPSPPVEIPPAAEPVRMRSFFLNGDPIQLPAKADDMPYYLMDLLDHTDLDFEHLERPVILRVNGEDSPFMRVLKDGDAVSIQVNE